LLIIFRSVNVTAIIASKVCMYDEGKSKIKILRKRSRRKTIKEPKLGQMAFPQRNPLNFHWATLHKLANNDGEEKKLQKKASQLLLR
jgi:hypothetical protein